MTVGFAHGPIAEVTVGKWGDDYPDLRIIDPGIGQKVEAFMNQITYGEVSHEEAFANASLIAEAGTVYHETGMTPLQMQSRIAELESKMEVGG